MAIAKKVKGNNHLPSINDGRFPVHSKQYNETIDTILAINPVEGTLSATTITTDTISESTAGSGVTVDGVLIKDGTITTTAPTIASVDPAITALGVDDTDGYALTEQISIITGGAANTGAELPSAVVGQQLTVANLTASDKLIYANTSDAIDDKTATTGSVILKPEQVAVFSCYTVALWQSDFESDAAYDTVYVDTIAEHTAAAGVTIDGVVLKDTTVDLNGTADALILDTDGDTSISSPTDDQIDFEAGGADIATITSLGVNVLIDGAVADPSVKIGSSENGFYEVSGTQLGASIGDALVATFESDGVHADATFLRVAIGTPGTGVVATHNGDGRNITTVLTLASQAIDPPTAGAAEGHGHLLYTFPAGAHMHEVTYMSMGLQGGGVVDADTPEIGIGSVIASGAVSVLDGTPTFEDYITGQVAADCSGTATVAMTAATAGYGTGISINIAASVKALHLNVADTWAGADTLAATGTVTIKWTIMS